MRSRGTIRKAHRAAATSTAGPPPYINSHPDPSRASALRLTWLRTAVTCGSDLAVGTLLARGADPSTPASKDKTLLDLALHIREFKREKNLRGQVDRIITMLETGRALPEFA